MKEILKLIGISGGTIATIFGVVLGTTRECNMIYNNHEISEQGHYSVSRAKGVMGHIEFTRYDDGSQDIKEYPWFGHRFLDSELRQDLNGDGQVDRIRQNGSETKMNRLVKILIRKHDYYKNKAKFDKADAQLRELMAKYPLKKKLF